MPISPLALTTRAGAGAALNVSQFDGNYAAIQTAVNALITQVAAQHTDAGALKSNAVQTAAQITDAIMTLAKLAVLGAGDYGKFIRASKTTGVISAMEIQTQMETKTTAINSAGVQAGLDIGVFSFLNVPAGDVLVWVKLSILRNSGANGGTITIANGATEIDDINTHCVDAGTTQWFELSLFGKLAAFAGGTLTLALTFETGEATSNVTFGVGGENRFGRRVMILAGL